MKLDTIGTSVSNPCNTGKAIANSAAHHVQHQDNNTNYGNGSTRTVENPKSATTAFCIRKEKKQRVDQPQWCFPTHHRTQRL
ncbi:unnamed protein product, partial [Orchesella dallaii]